MGNRIPGMQYAEHVTKSGKVMITDDVVLYAPDGSIFIMPVGGNPALYQAKTPPYKAKPDAEWEKANAIYEKTKADSLKVSNFQREIKNRAAAVDAARERSAVLLEMERLEEEMTAAEAALEAGDSPASISAPSIEDVEAVIKPKPKAKAKAKARAK